MTEQPQAPETVQCRSTKDPAVRAFILAAMLIGFGIWCALDQRPYAPLSDLNAFLLWAFNFYGRFVFTAVGVIAAAWAVLYLRRVLVADEEGVGFLGKEKIAWSNIQEVNARKLESDQLLYIEAPDHRLRLAGWQLRDFRHLVSFIERHVPPERIKR